MRQSCTGADILKWIEEIEKEVNEDENERIKNTT